MLTGLDGTNPLGFLAALGVVEVLTRNGRDARMAWTDDLVPNPVLTGAPDGSELIEVLDADRARWRQSVVLAGPANSPLDDVKTAPGVDREWALEVVASLDGGRADADLFCGLLAEGAVDRKGNAKPTHLHFTAGQQKFLVMVRELSVEVDEERLREAVFGPWQQGNQLPTLRWDPAIDRRYALHATRPSNSSPAGVPGADWLAVLGLSSIPVRAVSSSYDGTISLETNGCDSEWKKGAFRWPLWSGMSNLDVIRSIVADPGLVGSGDERRRARRAGIAEPTYLRTRGVLQVMESPIRRAENGGRGSFGGSATIAKAALP